VNMYARLEDAETAYEYLIKLLKNPFPNLFNAHRHPKLKYYPLTIEANFAATAGIIELLMQSHDGVIDFLPALPQAWSKGRVSGIRARGGYEITMEWDEGILSYAEIKSTLSRVCRIRTAEPILIDEIDYLVRENGTVEFVTEANKTYILKPLQLNAALT
jgi:alpha-L-fucosidase 2